MGLPELDTAARVGAPLLVVVFDDAAYGAEVHDFRPLGVPVDAALFPDRDLAAIARALGCAATTVCRASRTLDRRGGPWCAAPHGPPWSWTRRSIPRADAASLMTPLGAAGWSLAPRITEGTPT